MKEIAVLIPCFNEKYTIAKVVKDIKAHLPLSSVYVYDNNSTDGSDNIAKESGAIVRYVKKRGKGNVIKSMFSDINAKCYILVDGDDTYSLDNIKEMSNMVLNDGVDIVIGDRLSSTYFKENDRPFHGVGNSLVRFLINHFFKSDIKDPLSGLRCLSYDFVKNNAIKTNGFEVDTEMTIKGIIGNYSIRNYVIKYKKRCKNSKSKIHTFTDGIKILFTIFDLKFRQKS